MIRAILNGCGGAMGHVITRLCSDDTSIEIVAGIDIQKDDMLPYPVYGSVRECDQDADVVIDFSTAKAVDRLIDDCIAKKLPIVLCTTGLSDAQIDKIKAATDKIAILRSANMSLGVNLLLKLVKDAAKTLAPAGFDIEILEKHHHRKIDAPSGTAIALADSINEAMGGEYHYKLDRSQTREKRDPKEIGIQSIRGGNIVGEHDVYFCGEDEIVTISHTANSRAIFGKGAVAAAKFLAGKKPGLYGMEDVIG